MRGAYIFLADGFEDIEALGTLDILRRANIPSITVSIHDTPEVTSAHGVTVIAENLLDEFLDEGADLEDILVFPGGLPGASNLADCKPLIAYTKTHFQHGGPVAAICAAPGLVVSQLPGIVGRKVTCYDGFEDKLIAAGAAFYSGEGVVTDGNLITGRGPGVALQFGLAVVSYICGPELAAAIRKGMLMR